MLSSRKQDALDEAAATMTGEVATFAANAGEPDQAEACVQATIERFGAVDILVNNAATNPYMGPSIDIDLSRYDKTLQVNLRGPLVWTQLAWNASMREHGGSVINIASVGGIGVEPSIGIYNTTKAALIYLTRTLAVGARTRRAGQRDRARAGEDRHGTCVVGGERAGDGEAVPDAATGRARRHRERGPVLRQRPVVVDHRSHAGGRWRRSGPALRLSRFDSQYTTSQSAARRILPSAVRGSSSTSSTDRGAAHAPSCVLDRVAQLVECRRRAVVGGDDDRDDSLAPLGVVATDDRHLTHRRQREQHRLDRVGPHVLAAGDDHVVETPVHVETAGVVEATDVAGAEPTLAILRIGPAAVAAQQHRPPDRDLAVSASTATSTPSSGTPS